MTECANCGDEESELVDHHTDYEGDETVPVCPPCHGRIHGLSEHPLKPDGPRPANGNMKQTTVRFPEQQIEDMEELVSQSSLFADRSEFIRAAIEEKLVNEDDG